MHRGRTPSLNRKGTEMRLSLMQRMSMYAKTRTTLSAPISFMPKAVAQNRNMAS